MSSAPHMLSQALLYAGAGISVFPVNGKVPLTENGFHDATTDRRKIEAWWTTHPNAGIATPDFDAVDVDLYKPECTPTWEAIKPLIPERTPQTRTGGGGLQFLFQPHTLKDGKIGPGVDSRYAGRNYIVLPPSLHRSGNRYEVILSVLTTRPPPAPDFPHVSGDATEFRHLLNEMDAGKKIASGRNKAAWWRAVAILRTLPAGSDLEPVEALVQSWVDANCTGDLSEVDVPKQVAGAAKFVGDERAGKNETRPRAALTDLGNAELFAWRNAHRLRHVRERRQWLVYRPGRWHPDLTGEAERAAKEVARERLRGAADITDEDKQKRHVAWAMTSQSGPRLREMLTVASTEPTVVLAAEELDTDPFLLSCANGTLDLRTGMLRPPDPGDLITMGTEVAYIPDATCPRWDSFLEEIFDGDEALTAYIQRLTGYALTGDTREQIVVVLHGSGGNGKDTMIKPITKVIGEQALTASIDTFTRVRDRGVRNDLARLHRARLVVASENAEDRKLDEPTVKIVSGGNTIAARFLYGEFFEFVPQFKVWLITNHRPRVEGDDDAIWRRLRLIPFNVSFIGKEDKELDAKLEAELPGILAWAVLGCLDWQKHGLGLPKAVEKATSEYRSDEDVLGAFIAERCNLGAKTEVAPAYLREAYGQFCTELGEEPLSASVLGRRLALRGIKRANRGKRGSQRAVYEGIGLKSVP